MSDPKPYKSYIKVKGLNLLPPVITESRRSEIIKERTQAAKLERRLKLCRELKRSLDEFIAFHNDPSNLLESSKRIIASTRNAVSPKRQQKLTSKILDIAEYNDDGIKIIKINKDVVTPSKQGQSKYVRSRLRVNSCTSDTYDTDSSLNKSTEVAVSSVQSSVRVRPSRVLKSPSKKIINEKPILKESPSKQGKKISCTRIPQSIKPVKSPNSPPRLIRSNSYVLDAPSPSLLVHLKRCSEENAQLFSSSLPKNWDSSQYNFEPPDNVESSNTTLVDDNEDLTSNKSIAENNLNQLSNETQSIQKDLEQKSPTLEVGKRDLSVQKLVLNTNSEETETVKSTVYLPDGDSPFIKVLRKVPDDCAKKVIELLKNQKSEIGSLQNQISNTTNEQSTLKKDEGQMNSKDSELSNSSDFSTLLEPFSDKSDKIHEKKIKEIVPYQKSNSPDDSDNIPFPIIDDDTLFKNISKLKIPEKDWSTSVTQMFVNKRYTPDDAVSKEEKIPISSEASFSNNTRHMSDAKKKWAADLICAYVKGYLTRRLLKTWKVQSLIETIKDALICALELHKCENIVESDIELHRRLINQVSAACSSFHDIFFTLPVHEQMALIASDRKRLSDSSRRPSSARNIRRTTSNTSQSSSKGFHSRSQTLMKS